MIKLGLNEKVYELRARRHAKLAAYCGAQGVDFYSAGHHYREAGFNFRMAGLSEDAAAMLTKSSRSFEKEAMARAPWVGIISASEGSKNTAVRVQEVVRCLREAQISAEYADQLKRAWMLKNAAEKLGSGEIAPELLYAIVRL